MNSDANSTHKVSRAPLRTSLLFALLLLIVLGSSQRHTSPRPAKPNQTSPQTEMPAEMPQDLVRVLIQAVEEPVMEAPEPAAPPLDHSTLEPSDIREGESPEIKGRFDLPVRDYLGLVAARANGRLLIWDKAAGAAVGEVVADQFKPVATLKNYSARARDLTNDLPHSFRVPVLEQVRQYHEFGIWRFVLVIPQAEEQFFRESISAVLQDAGLEWEELDLLELRYGLSDGKLVARLESASREGRTIAINRKVELW